MAIEGSLESVDIQDIVQLLNINRSTGLLHIKSSSLVGILYYRDGEIEDATVEGMQGEAAAYVLLSQSEGQFQFEVAEHHARRRINRSIHDLVLESARRKDTINKIRASIKHDNIVFLPLVDVRIPQFRKEFNDFEIQLLQQLDGQKEIKNIIEKQKESIFEVFYVIYELENRGYLKRVDIYKILEVVEFKKLFGKANEVFLPPHIGEEWTNQSMTYANCDVVELRTRHNTFGQVGMTIRANIDPGKIAMPKGIMAQFEVSPGEKVLVKPIIHPS
jgi:hypothetical protein